MDELVEVRLTPEPAATIAEVLSLFERWGDDHYDEALSQREHALQAATLAARDGAPDALVAAALLHDVGHLLDLAARGADAPAQVAAAETGVDRRHEAAGARYLARLLPSSVTAPIALHVQAKRYLCTVDPAYAASLSDGSRRSLALQGGPLGEASVAAFEHHPAHAAALALRRWDDGAKLEDPVADGLDVIGLESWVPLLRHLARRR